MSNQILENQKTVMEKHFYPTNAVDKISTGQLV